jgi:CelD/BcsL family acetyltransferase involved in cellulose biosynthesis
MMALSIGVVDDAAAFAELQPDWDGLVERSRSANLFSTFEWQWTAWDYRREVERPFIVAVRDGAELVGLLPLRPLSPRAPKTLVPIGMGYRSLAEYHDVIAATGYEEAVLEQVLAFLAGQAAWKLFEWPEISERSTSFGSITRAAGRAGLHVVMTPGTVCRRVELPSTWPEYVARLSPSMREFERRERKLSREHDARFERVTEEAAIEPALAAVQAMQERRWSASGSSPDHAAFIGFLRRLCPALLRRGWLDLQTLRVDGELVGVNVDFRFRDTAYGYVTAFDADHRSSRHGFGTLLAANGFRWAIEDGLRVFDLSRGDDGYKNRWASVASRNYRARIVRSQAHAVYYRCRDLARGLRERFRPTVRPGPRRLGAEAATIAWSLEPIAAALEPVIALDLRAVL